MFDGKSASWTFPTQPSKLTNLLNRVTKNNFLISIPITHWYTEQKLLLMSRDISKILVHTNHEPICRDGNGMEVVWWNERHCSNSKIKIFHRVIKNYCSLIPVYIPTVIFQGTGIADNGSQCYREKSFWLNKLLDGSNDMRGTTASQFARKRGCFAAIMLSSIARYSQGWICGANQWRYRMD